MMTLPATTLRLRLVSGIAATAAVTAALMIGPLALRSSAADYTANSEATWRAALVAAMANTGEANTITITGDFAMSDPTGTSPEYTGVAQDLIIDGGGHTVSAASGNTAGFLSASDATGSVTLQNITIDGFATNFAVSIRVDGDVTLDNVTVRNFEGDGSALYASGASFTVTNSTFTDNVGYNYGTALYAGGGSLSIQNSTFTGNTSTMVGGAVYSEVPVEVQDSTFTDNTAVEGGGAIYSEDYTDIYDSTFTGNSTEGDGGAVWSEDAGYSFSSTFRGNSAEGDGGAVYENAGIFEEHDSTFANNTAGGAGGALYTSAWGDSYGSTWVGNRAAYGGAIYVVNDELGGAYTWIEESTFVNNHASVDGGAIYLEFSYVETYNSVFSVNEADGSAAHVYVNNDSLYTYATVFEGAVGSDGCYADGSAESRGYNFDDDGSCTNEWGQDGDFGDGASPMLGALADNGGPTQTLLPLAGSPLIDAIPWDDCDSNAAGPDDQRGVNRSETGAEDDGCDIGSVEVIKDFSFPMVGASGTTTVTVAGAVGYDCDAWTPIADYLPAPPAGVAFPHGVFSYCFYVPGDGWTVTVTLDLPSPVNQFWKDTGGTWAQVPGAVISGTTITYDVTDGGALDADGESNSYIVDPVAGGRGASFTG
jgi:predicted outer membrane repeat protein